MEFSKHIFNTDAVPKRATRSKSRQIKWKRLIQRERDILHIEKYFSPILKCYCCIKKKKFRESMDQSRSRKKKEKVRLVSPVKEGSGVIPFHIIPKGSRMPKQTEGHAPILVQALPPASKNYNEQRNKDVDQVVAEYLDYAKYGHPLPSEGPDEDLRGGNLICGCCADRNRESFHKKFSKQHRSFSSNTGKAKDLPEHHIKEPDSLVQNSQLSLRLTMNQSEDGSHFVDRVPSQHKFASQLSPHHSLQNWCYYQPTPQPGTFLNPELNRPFIKRSLKNNNREVAQQRYIIRKVLEASSKYEYSMQKLQETIENGFALPHGAIYFGRRRH